MFKSISIFHPKYASISRNIFLGTALCIVVVIGFLYINVREELGELATHDSVLEEWAFIDITASHFDLLYKLEKAKSGNIDDLAMARESYTVLESHLNQISHNDHSDHGTGAHNHSPETTTKEITAQLNTVKSAVIPLALYMSLPDGDLFASLDDIIEIQLQTQADIISLAEMSEQQFFAAHGDVSGTIYSALLNIVILSVLLLIILLISIYMLSKLSSVNLSRAQQNRLSNSRMTAILNSSLDAIVAVNKQGKVIDFNGAAEEIFGYSKEEATGGHLADLIIPEHLREAHENGMQRYLDTHEKRVVDKGRVRLEAKRKNGDIFPVELSIASAMGTNDEIFVSYLRDISTEVAYEDELRKARDAAVAGEKSKSKLLAVMSHEMRTPLNGMLGTMELMGGTRLSDQQKRYLRIMNKSGSLLMSHVNDVLDISRLEAGMMEIENSVFDLNALIEDLIESQQVAAKQNGNTMHFKSAGPAQMLVSSDPLRLRQVLLNLLGNAVKFTQDGTVTVEVEVLPDGESIEIRVIDTGIGISEENISRVFGDFTTLDSSYGRRTEGTGLGLGIARRIVRAMDGEIGLESELDEGSLFWVRLPISLEEDYLGTHTNMAEAQNVDAASGNALNILLIEDNEINRMVARDFLESDNHTVTEAHDGVQGVKVSEKTQYDVILMDISMPEMDGLEATKAIRSGDGASKSTPILALTAHALEEDEKRFLAAGMDEVIVKPVTKKSLRAAMRALQNINTKTAQSSKNETGLVDIQNILSFRNDLGEDKFQTIFEKFVKEMDEDLQKLEDNAVAGDDANDIAKLAHRLAGSAASFGARKLRQTLNALEVKAKAKPTESHAELAQSAGAIWAETRQALYKLF